MLWSTIVYYLLYFTVMLFMQNKVVNIYKIVVAFPFNLISVGQVPEDDIDEIVYFVGIYINFYMYIL